jgi:galactokinase/mevalonate kinase-like predicted kinase
VTKVTFVVSAPVRVDLAGGVTDVPDFARLVGTDVTNVAIDLFTDHDATSPVGIEVRVAGSTEGADGAVVVREAGRSAPAGGAVTRKDSLPRQIVEGLLPPSWTSGVAVEVRSDLPRRTGLGASSSLAVCLAAGLDALTAQGQRSRQCCDAEVLDANAIVKRAHHAEVVMAGVVGGFQDFVAAFFGGVNHITFSDLASTDLDRRRGSLGVGVPEDLRQYLDANLIVTVRTERTISSDMVVDDHVTSSLARPDEFVCCLGRIKALNAKVFPLLTRQDGALEDRLGRLGAAMTASWDQRKMLSSMVGRGLVAEIEAAVRPLCVGMHGPGSGVNSLLFVTTPERHEQVMTALDVFRPDIMVFQAKVNTAGVRVERVDSAGELRQDTAVSRHAE